MTENNKVIAVDDNKVNPKAYYLEDDEIKLVLEENKLNKARLTNNPELAIEIMKVLFDTDNVVSIKDIFLPEEKYDYLGLSYDKNIFLGIIKSYQLYYEQFTSEYATPKDFFNRISQLLKRDLEIAWFQDKWRTNDNYFDLNRCIIQKINDDVKCKQLDKELEKVPLLKRVFDENKDIFIGISNSNAYNPEQAIKLLKKKKIDVLVLGNIICSLKKLED